MKVHRNLIFIMTVSLVLSGICTASAKAEETASPESVVKKFARAYFMLDPAMEQYLSDDAKTNARGMDMVELYLDQRAYEARQQGYEPSYLQMLPVGMKARVTDRSDKTATVEFTATAIRSINPLYRIVGYIFGMLEEHEVEQTVTVVKEDGEWKVGPGAFDLPRPT